MKKKSIAKILGFAICGIQLIATAVLLYLLMNVLPSKWWLAAAGVLVVDLLFTFALQFTKGAHWFGKLVSILTLVVLAVGIYYLGNATDTLKKITSNNKAGTDEICVIVKTDSPYQVLEDIKGKTCGIQYQNDKELMEKAADSIGEELDQDITMKEYENYEALYPELISGNLDAMIISGPYLNVMDDISMEEQDYVFSEEIRILKSYEFETEEEVVQKKVKEGFKITKDPFTIFISGIDTYGPITTKSRSDVNILMTVNPTTHQILLVTTPRDAYTILPGVSGDSKDKLTHSGIYGVQCSIDTLDYIYDIDINYYARVNFNSLISIIDALGGVSVYSQYDFTVGGYHFNKGMNKMDGAQALVFARERHSFAEGDFQRGRDQMEVIKGIVRRCCTPAVLTGFTGILESVGDQVQTSLEVDDMFALVKMQLKDNQPWDIFSYEVAGDVGREYCYSYSGKSLSVTKLKQVSVEKAAGLMHWMQEGNEISEKDVEQ